jgi:hypothetical protein
MNTEGRLVKRGVCSAALKSCNFEKACWDCIKHGDGHTTGSSIAG